MNILCGICHDSLNVQHSKGEAGTNACALPCGHVFHFSCVKLWFDASKSAVRGTCPQCRTALIKTKALKLYWDVVALEINDDPAVVKAVNDCLKKENQDLTDRLKTAREKLDQAAKQNQALRENIVTLENKLSASALTDRMLLVTRQKLNTKTKEMEKIKDEVELLRKKNESMRVCNTVLNGTLKTDEEKEAFLVMEKDQLVMLCMNLRRDGRKLENRYESVRQDLMKAQSEKRALQKDLEKYVGEMSILTNVLDSYKRNAHKIPRLSSAQLSSGTSSGETQKSYNSESPLRFAQISPLVLSDDSPPFKVPKVDTPCLPKRSLGGAIPRTRQLGSKRPAGITVAASSIRINSDCPTVDPRRSPSSPMSPAKLLKPEFYDGLGGHSRLDDFPKPKITTDRKLFKPQRTAKK